ncbi:hypothetical protein QBC44DRAFT_365842 [Cladorrhinum sp. PSN332]|nr:hypothetical protein QBC44DRAFT_365842 [Cladorrhinum sp. PSN332]
MDFIQIEDGGYQTTQVQYVNPADLILPPRFRETTQSPTAEGFADGEASDSDEDDGKTVVLGSEVSDYEMEDSWNFQGNHSQEKENDGEGEWDNHLLFLRDIFADSDDGGKDGMVDMEGQVSIETFVGQHNDAMSQTPPVGDQQQVASLPSIPLSTPPVSPTSSQTPFQASETLTSTAPPTAEAPSHQPNVGDMDPQPAEAVPLVRPAYRKSKRGGRVAEGETTSCRSDSPSRPPKRPREKAERGAKRVDDDTTDGDSVPTKRSSSRLRSLRASNRRISPDPNPSDTQYSPSPPTSPKSEDIPNRKRRRRSAKPVKAPEAVKIPEAVKPVKPVKPVKAPEPAKVPERRGMFWQNSITWDSEMGLSKMCRPKVMRPEDNLWDLVYHKLVKPSIPTPPQSLPTGDNSDNPDKIQLPAVNWMYCGTSANGTTRRALGLGKLPPLCALDLGTRDWSSTVLSGPMKPIQPQPLRPYPARLSVGEVINREEQAKEVIESNDDSNKEQEKQMEEGGRLRV